jgi:periplasmic protein TonB
MDAKQILTANLDDIVFEGRNKEYGAYLLRRSYEKNIRRGTIGGIIMFLFIVSVPYISKWVSEISGANMADEEIIVSLELEAPPPLNPDEPPPPPPPDIPPPPPPSKPTIRYTPPVVKADEEVVDEEPPPMVEELKDIAIATKTQEGSEDGVDLGILDEYGDGPVAPPVVEAPPPKEEVFTRVEQMPQFGSGERELLEYLQKNIKYPAIARENGIQGTVVVQFVVDKDGSITIPEVVRGIGGGCDEEALRVVREMPKWQPGKQQGRPVKVKFTLPVRFRLE